MVGGQGASPAFERILRAYVALGLTDADWARLYRTLKKELETTENPSPTPSSPDPSFDKCLALALKEMRFGNASNMDGAFRAAERQLAKMSGTQQTRSRARLCEAKARLLMRDGTDAFDRLREAQEAWTQLGRPKENRRVSALIAHSLLASDHELRGLAADFGRAALFELVRTDERETSCRAHFSLSLSYSEHAKALRHIQEAATDVRTAAASPIDSTLAIQVRCRELELSAMDKSQVESSLTILLQDTRAVKEVGTNPDPEAMGTFLLANRRLSRAAFAGDASVGDSSAQRLYPTGQ